MKKFSDNQQTEHFSQCSPFVTLEEKFTLNQSDSCYIQPIAYSTNYIQQIAKI